MKRQEIILLSLVFVISIYIWRHVPFTQFQGEGFIYFTSSILDFPAKFSLPFDFFARAFFLTLPNLFGGQVHLYMWLQFIWMILTDIAFYLMVRTITKNGFIAILATFFFSLSYVGKYDMYSIGGYQYFVQRGAILLPLLFSFMYLVKCLYRTSFLPYYFLSLFLFSFSILVGFFGTWLLPLFLIYPVFYLIYNWKTAKKYIGRLVWIPIPFLLANLLIISQSGFIPGESIQSFVFNNIPHVVMGILQQLAVITPGLGELLNLYDKGSMQFERILIFTAVLYIVSFLIVYKANKSLRAVAATSIAALSAIFLFNMYLNEANVLHTFGSSRYFYYPLTLVALFWSLFFYSIAVKARLFFVLTILICLMWVPYNIYRINKNLNADAWIQKANSYAIDYVQELYPRLENGSLVQLPASIGGWGREFVARFYSKPGVKYSLEISEPLEIEKLVEQEIDHSKVYVLHFDPREQIVIDHTELIRKQILEFNKKGKFSESL